MLSIVLRNFLIRHILLSGELSARSGVSERYLEEWCRAAVLHGYLQLHCSEEPAAPRPWDSGMEVRGTERFSMRSVSSSY